MTESCQLISKAAKVALDGSDPPTHVATFGDVTVEEVGDWFQIISNEPGSAVSIIVSYMELI